MIKGGRGNIKKSGKRSRDKRNIKRRSAYWSRRGGKNYQVGFECGVSGLPLPQGLRSLGAPSAERSGDLECKRREGGRRAVAWAGQCGESDEEAEAGGV